MTSFDERVWAVVRRIPRGRVASYRQVAALAGSPMASRIVAGALRRGTDLPWWRVLGSKGDIRLMHPLLRREQWDRLLQEGVEVDADGCVDMERRAWKPATTRARPPRRRRGRPGSS